MTTHIKKDFVELVAFLETNKNKKVETILEQLKELCSSKNVMASTLRRDEEGNVTHVYCYYHKEWEDVSVIPYGNKYNTASGLNTMCKQGVNQWTKQQRVYKSTIAQIGSDLMEGKITTEQALELRTRAEAAKDLIVPYTEPKAE